MRWGLKRLVGLVMTEAWYDKYDFDEAVNPLFIQSKELDFPLTEEPNVSVNNLRQDWS